MRSDEVVRNAPASSERRKAKLRDEPTLRIVRPSFTANGSAAEMVRLPANGVACFSRTRAARVNLRVRAEPPLHRLAWNPDLVGESKDPENPYVPPRHIDLEPA